MSESRPLAESSDNCDLGTYLLIRNVPPWFTLKDLRNYFFHFREKEAFIYFNHIPLCEDHRLNLIKNIKCSQKFDLLKSTNSVSNGEGPTVNVFESEITNWSKQIGPANSEFKKEINDRPKHLYNSGAIDFDGPAVKEFESEINNRPKQLCNSDASNFESHADSELKTEIGDRPKHLCNSGPNSGESPAVKTRNVVLQALLSGHIPTPEKLCDSTVSDFSKTSSACKVEKRNENAADTDSMENKMSKPNQSQFNDGGIHKIKAETQVNNSCNVTIVNCSNLKEDASSSVSLKNHDISEESSVMQQDLSLQSKNNSILNQDASSDISFKNNDEAFVVKQQQQPLPLLLKNNSILSQNASSSVSLRNNSSEKVSVARQQELPLQLQNNIQHSNNKCFLVLIHDDFVESFKLSYNRKFWVTREGVLLPSRCFIFELNMESKIVKFLLELRMCIKEPGGFVKRMGEDRAFRNRVYSFGLGISKDMPWGNVGTSLTYLRDLHKRGNLPNMAIDRLGLVFDHRPKEMHQRTKFIIEDDPIIMQQLQEGLFTENGFLIPGNFDIQFNLVIQQNKVSTQDILALLQNEKAEAMVGDDVLFDSINYAERDRELRFQTDIQTVLERCKNGLIFYADGKLWRTSQSHPGIKCIDVKKTNLSNKKLNKQRRREEAMIKQKEAEIRKEKIEKLLRTLTLSEKKEREEILLRIKKDPQVNATQRNHLSTDMALLRAWAQNSSAKEKERNDEKLSKILAKKMRREVEKIKQEEECTILTKKMRREVAKIKQEEEIRNKKIKKLLRTLTPSEKKEREELLLRMKQDPQVNETQRKQFSTDMVLLRAWALNFNTEKADPNVFGSFEKFTKGIGRRLLEAQGWKEGQGLGKDGKGIVTPVSLAFVELKNKEGFGYKTSKPPKNF